MRVLVLGGGVIGVTTACCLARDGHEVPIPGFARYGNLMLDVGHGHIGWMMSCGSAKVVADLLAGRDPEIDLDGMLHSGVG